MKILNTIRSRVSRGAVGHADADSTGEAELPIARYDRLDAKHVSAELSKHSQTELATIETYERSHQDREVVLHKLRYLRGSEPLEGYDLLTPEEISGALEGADLPTLSAVREYERKFRRRPPVLQELARVRSERLSVPTAGS